MMQSEEENAKEMMEREEENGKVVTEREEENAEEITESGEEIAKGEEDNPAPAPPKKKRRRAGELSGRQIALHKFEQDGQKTFNIKMLPNAGYLLRELRKVLTTFSGGHEDGFTREEAAAMHIYTALRLGLRTTVSLASTQ